MKDGIYFTDMGRCYPSSAISEKRGKRNWKKIPYETDNFSGVLVVASYCADPPVITLPIDIKGNHSIFVGLYGEFGFHCGVQIKLKSEKYFCPLFVHDSSSRGENIHEVFWKEADLTGESIEFAAFNKKDMDGFNSGVAYIKLVPAETQRNHDERPDIYLAGFIDAYSFIYYTRPVTIKEIQQQIEMFRGTPFKKNILGACSR